MLHREEKVMLTILLILGVFGLCGKLIGLALKASWGLFKIIGGIIIFPLMLIVLILSGILYLAIPLLIIAGLVAIFAPKRGL